MFTVTYPSFANPDFPSGLTNWRVFENLRDAVRFASDTQAKLRRAHGPAAAARVAVEGPAEREAAEAAADAEYDAHVNR